MHNCLNLGDVESSHVRNLHLSQVLKGRRGEDGKVIPNPIDFGLPD